MCRPPSCTHASPGCVVCVVLSTARSCNSLLGAIAGLQAKVEPESAKQHTKKRTGNNTALPTVLPEDEATLEFLLGMIRHVKVYAVHMPS